MVILCNFCQGNCCWGNHTKVIWRAPYELHRMHQCRLQIN